MTLFGWVYLILTIIGSLTAINDIGKERKPRTSQEIAALLLFNGLTFWALYTWGIRG